MPQRYARSPLVGLALLSFAIVPAAALEPNAVADALGAALTKGSQAQASYEAATLADGNVVITGLTLSGTASAQAVRFNEALVESPTEDDAALFRSPRITLTDGMALGDRSGSVGAIIATDVTVLDPETVEGEGFAEAILYRSAEIRDVKVTRNSVPRDMAVERISVAFAEAGGDGPRDVSGTVEGLSVSGDVFEHRRFSILARARLRLEELNYEALVFDADWAGTWDKAAGTMAIRESTFTFRDNAKVSATGTVGNLPDPRVLNDADVVSQVAKLQFHDLVARYEEVAFAGRVFDLMANEQELTRAEYVDQLSLALPFLLASLTHPDFREELIEGLRTFFREPRSLTLTIDPEKPISGTEIIRIGRSELGALPDRLKAKVHANGEE